MLVRALTRKWESSSALFVVPVIIASTKTVKLTFMSRLKANKTDSPIVPCQFSFKLSLEQKGDGQILFIFLVK